MIAYVILLKHYDRWPFIYFSLMLGGDTPIVPLLDPALPSLFFFIEAKLMSAVFFSVEFCITSTYSFILS